MPTTSESDRIASLISAAINFVSLALELCNRLPELHIGSPTSINLGAFGSESVAVKQQIRSDLEILSTALRRLQLRARLPLVVGVIGRYNSGKSSLLNSFFRKLYSRDLPAGLARKTENTATDTVLTYITHPDLAPQFHHVHEIVTVPVNHDAFRAMNFIDTPGTGWTSLDKKEVVDLLSSADILLFVSRPLDLLDDLSVQVLNQKFTIFAETPMWYVVTFASMYADSLRKSEKLDESHFHKDLIEAKAKLKIRPCADADGLSARDLVAARVDYDLGKNTFLVDSLRDFGTSELLDKIMTTFNNTEARIAKRKGLALEVDAAYASLLRILNRATEHVSAINRTINLAYRKSIHPEIEKFIATGVAAEIAETTQILYSYTGEARSNTDQYARGESPPPTVTYSTEAAEVTILRSDLESMKDRRRSHSYVYRQASLLFDMNLIHSRMEWLKLNAVQSVSKQLEKLWAERSTKGLSLVSSSVNEVISQVIDQEARAIERIIVDRVESQRNTLEDYLRIPGQRLRNLYSSSDIGSTIFARQNRVLRAMERDIPSTYEELLSRQRAAFEAAQAMRSSLATKFGTDIRSRVTAFAGAASRLLHDSVYVPTHESLFFLLGDTESNNTKLPDQKETERHLIDVASRLIESLHKDDAGLQRSLEQLSKDTESALLEQKNHWDNEWNELKGQFEVLADNAKQVAGKLDDKLKELSKLLDLAKTDGLHAVNLNVREIANRVSNVVRQKADQINISVNDARSKAAVKYRFEVGGLVLTLVGSAIAVWKSWVMGNASIIPFITILTMAVAIVAWIVNQLRTKSEAEERNITLVFKGRVDELQQTLDVIATTKISEMCNDIDARNSHLAGLLDNLYAAIIDSCEAANEKIVPSLMNQIEAGTHVALSTQKKIAMIAATGIARSAQHLLTSLDRTARQTADQMRNQFASIVRDSGESCGQAVETHVRAYRNLAEDLQQLIASVQKMTTQPHAVTRADF